MKTIVSRTALAAVAMAVAGVASAQGGGALIMEGAYDRPASNLAFCGPCMTLWYVGAAPGAKVDFTIEEPFPSAAPVVQSDTADPFGVALYLYKPRGEGEVRLQASSGPQRVRPTGCIPPIGPPRECAPRPTNPVRAVEKEAITIPLAETAAPPARVTLQQFRALPEPHWEAVVGKATLAAKPAPEIRIGRLGLKPGLYRLQLVGKQKEILAVSLLRVDPKQP